MFCRVAAGAVAGDRYRAPPPGGVRPALHNQGAAQDFGLAPADVSEVSSPPPLRSDPGSRRPSSRTSLQRVRCGVQSEGFIVAKFAEIQGSSVKVSAQTPSFRPPNNMAGCTSDPGTEQKSGILLGSFQQW